MEKIIVNTDGASRGNPGKAALSFVISDQIGNILDKGGSFLGIATNNEAEYQAVIAALERVTSLFPNCQLHVEVRSDSRLIVEQLKGNFKIKNDRMMACFNKVRELEEKVGEVSYVQIPRGENSRADELANQVLDKVN